MQVPTGGKAREPKGRSGEIPEPTVQSGWKKMIRIAVIFAAESGYRL